MFSNGSWIPVAVFEMPIDMQPSPIAAPVYAEVSIDLAA